MADCRFASAAVEADRDRSVLHCVRHRDSHGLTLAGHHTAAFVITPARTDAIAVGAMLALTARDDRGLARIAVSAPRVGAVLGLILLVMGMFRGGLPPKMPSFSRSGKRFSHFSLDRYLNLSHK